MKYGYARVWTEQQNIALKNAGCKTVFTDEGISGASAQRPALLRCLKALQAGDTLIVWKLDRLVRNLRDLIRMLDELKHRGVKFRSLTEAIDTDTATGWAMWQMICVLRGQLRAAATARDAAAFAAISSEPYALHWDGPSLLASAAIRTNPRPTPDPTRIHTRRVTGNQAASYS